MPPASALASMRSWPSAAPSPTTATSTCSSSSNNRPLRRATNQRGGGCSTISALGKKRGERDDRKREKDLSKTIFKTRNMCFPGCSFLFSSGGASFSPETCSFLSRYVTLILIYNFFSFFCALVFAVFMSPFFSYSAPLVLPTSADDCRTTHYNEYVGDSKAFGAIRKSLVIVLPTRLTRRSFST